MRAMSIALLLILCASCRGSPPTVTSVAAQETSPLPSARVVTDQEKQLLLETCMRVGYAAIEVLSALNEDDGYRVRRYLFDQFAGARERLGVSLSDYGRLQSKAELLAWNDIRGERSSELARAGSAACSAIGVDMTPAVDALRYQIQ